jgi:vacuolar protein sorting-associated protein 26
MNFCRCYKSWLHQEKCGIISRLTLSSRMSRSSTRVTMASTSNYGMPFSDLLWRLMMCSYFIRVTVSRRMADVIREKDLWVYSFKPPVESNSSIKMDVGIEDCLHIEFEYSKSKSTTSSPKLTPCRYHLKDVIVGKIYFLLVRLKIKHMELSIIRRETTGTAPNQYNESDTITKFEIMDGAPVRGETIPIRLFLGGFDLTPTFKDVNKKFSTRYYLSLVLVDHDGRRYFKQSEITLVRIPFWDSAH